MFPRQLYLDQYETVYDTTLHALDLLIYHLHISDDQSVFLGFQSQCRSWCAHHKTETLRNLYDTRDLQCHICIHPMRKGIALSIPAQMKLALTAPSASPTMAST